MRYKMVITDLDGTFLNNQAVIPERNKHAIKILQDNNIRFVISSGRSFQSLDKFLQILKINNSGEYGIAFNGACVYEADTFKKIYKSLLQHEIMNFILDKLKNFNVQISIYDGEGKLFSNTHSPVLEDYAKRAFIPFKIIKNFDEIKSDIFKILLDGNNNELTEIYNYMLPQVDGIANVFFSCKTLLEFTNLKATKGEAAKFLAGQLNILPSEIITIGDNYNDISMIEAAGLGVAVSNAEEEVKKSAHYITESSNNEGTLFEVVSKFILER